MELAIPVVAALVLGFVAWNVLKGMIKIGALVILAAVAIYFLAQGGI